ncbi:PLP-dependent aminotransferase family protein [Sporocytophaga myxococcoides]|uniref:aminotransferase-like domain-containing protein n=1 Tax=Sporocytophaga myxococcoides TaxID=153721 RepID=UPI000428DE66|nr:PLP-dependent aminotransferase family protein [Sporocytophaga myxococcoides]
MKTETEFYEFSERTNSIPVSFIREILKVASSKDLISFAGGLPNAGFFPTKALQEISNKVIKEDGAKALQYNVTEGYLPLKEWIVKWYRTKRGIDVSTDEILITSGSQQGLDLIGKIFINKGDQIFMENPGYLGAIQSFSAYQPEFVPVSLTSQGIDVKELKEKTTHIKGKFIYGVPNFQNPTGITYSLETRIKLAQLLDEKKLLFVEDDPYGDIRFKGKALPGLLTLNRRRTIHLGSFSKMISPGLRLGWIIANKEIISKLVLAKQASDLHTNMLSQMIVSEFLHQNGIEDHLDLLHKEYGKRCDLMRSLILEFFPNTAEVSQPEGGMFMWVKLPEEYPVKDILEESIKAGVLFVPGAEFCTSIAKENAMRLNFSNASEEEILLGIVKIGMAIDKCRKKGS